MALGYRLQDESRVLTKEEAYHQLGLSASLFRAVLEYARKAIDRLMRTPTAGWSGK
jgi:hypothetical protein